MFYEAIYTRCGKGINIEKDGQPELSEGYKVYSCSSELFTQDVVDLHALASEMQAKQSFSDPGFMDDAYLFLKMGNNSIYVDFHPIHFDPNTSGNFAKRPGNYINHAIIGDFKDIYPFELFNDSNVWYAKERGEDYYYSTDPTPIEPRKIIESEAAFYSVNDIKSFIEDGRQEALQCAVAFIISQDLNENKKYLVILDDSTRNLELWIAAIECAFSPEIATNVTFATRMDNFINKNRVKPSGAAAQGVNIYNANQIDYRAMVIGVNLTDKANVSLAKPSPIAQFGLLDGRQKKAMFDVDISDEYYNVISSFDDDHISFCREFLQTFEVGKPSLDVIKLYQCYKVLQQDNVSNSQYASVLEQLKKYKMHPTDMLRGLYEEAKEKLDICLEGDAANAFSIMDWIRETAVSLGEDNVDAELSEKICDVMENIVYLNQHDTKPEKLWNKVKTSSFAKACAMRITASETVCAHENDIINSSPANVLQAARIFAEGCRITGEAKNSAASKLVKCGIQVCTREADEQSLNGILSEFDTLLKTASRKFWIEIAKSGDMNVRSILINHIISSDNSIISSEKSLTDFCAILKENGLGSFAIVALKRYISSFRSADEIEAFAKTIDSMEYVSSDDKSKLFQLLDSIITVKMKGSERAAASIVKYGRKKDCYTNSVHILAVYHIHNKHKKEDITSILMQLAEQGVPSWNNNDYIAAYTDAVLKADLSVDELTIICNEIVCQPDTYYRAILIALIPNASKKPAIWESLINSASESLNSKNKNTLCQVLADVMVETSQNKKTISRLGSLLKEKKAISFFDRASEKALEQINDSSGVKGFFARLRK